MSRIARGGRYSLDAFRHQALGEVGSTNTECLARARQGDPGNLWVTATRQTAGRGRRGRSWASEPGNLYASLLLIDPAPPERLGSLPLAVALAVHGALRSVLPPGAEALEIKWPNDVLIGRKKSCGILLEGEGLAQGRRALVAGIGINIRFRPEDGPYGVTSLQEQGSDISAEELFSHLYREMAEVLVLWDEGRAVAAITERWRSVACGIGEPIRVNLPDRSIDGRFAGIDDRGLLLLDTQHGTMPIAAGDVFFL
ncbi:BirA family transcriptional regulator, biotin operon repressor / biotin-[acetyl-CoA-carboxylase] ligase [Rhizobium sp. RU35A]|uniref:biotin--[biotin carboxyl-carrier protein] ligase n=1 Tax=Rhizobium straminoryzae TaxID=1387186 RepID=A0A549TIQ9_9HYPH|nr:MULTISPECIES: biotin--[acetyl-CoA-carboxylase] ligase [Rhizobium]TRL43446.1 biotin--[acetyl-CoA-carboxylase] ligase [Rhizobium straminoryzae]SIP89399.1 BirA family transcriptional regulator, biotin operon repressor / biotin-[acetyl-CoA-carboxylase] ligase [Rhizobium sp. RU35A]